MVIAVTITINGADAPSSYWDDNYSQPYFDNTTRRDVTVTIGQTAVLHCRVRNLGDRAVSTWFDVVQFQAKFIMINKDTWAKFNFIMIEYLIGFVFPPFLTLLKIS